MILDSRTPALVFLFISVYLFSEVRGLNCWNCTGAETSECWDINPETTNIRKQTCPDNLRNPRCVKLTSHQGKKQLQITRYCKSGNDREVKETDHQCITLQVGERSMTTCYCDTDLCNSSPALKEGLYSLPLVLVAVSATLLHV